MKDILDYNPKDHIIIKGAYLHNLKQIDVAIPRNKLTVITKNLNAVKFIIFTI